MVQYDTIFLFGSAYSLASFSRLSTDTPESSETYSAVYGASSFL